MEETKKEVSAEELAAEQAALQESKEDEIRSKVIAEFGFDEVDDVERIDKLVAKEMEHSKKMSQAIGQKIKWRTEATKSKETTPTEVKKDNVVPTLDIDKKLAETLDKRDLDALDYPEELKKEIQKVASLAGGLKQALKDPYIVFKVNEFNKENEVEEAAITKTNRSGGNKGSYSLDKVPDVDMSTPEGREKYDKWKAEMVKKGY